jgi:prevent-host-death family protein
MKRTMGAAEFKAKCLAVLDEVGPEGIVITKHGKPVAKLIPVETGFVDLIGRLEGRLRVKGNVLSTGLRWNAEP